MVRSFNIKDFKNTDLIYECPFPTVAVRVNIIEAPATHSSPSLDRYTTFRMRSLSTSTAHVDASSSSSAQASALTNTLLVSKAITRIPLTDSQLDQFPGPTSENLWSLPLTRLETLVGLPLSAFFDPHPGSSQIDESLTFLSSSTVSLLLSQSESLNRSFSAANSTAMFVTPGSSTVESVPNGSTTIVISSSSKTNGNQATTTLTSTSTYRPSESASSEPITASTTVVMATSIDGNTLVRSSITTIVSRRASRFVTELTTCCSLQFYLPPYHRPS